MSEQKVLTADDIKRICKGHSCRPAFSAKCDCNCGRAYNENWECVISQFRHSGIQCKCVPAAPPTPATRGKEQEQAHKSLNDYCAEVHKANEKWWFHLETGKPLDRNFGELIALVHSELSEALEGHRKNLMDDKLPHRKMVEVELADTVIRIFDICAGLGFDLDGAYREKMAYNAVREDHKKEARLKADGKKY